MSPMTHRRCEKLMPQTTDLHVRALHRRKKSVHHIRPLLDQKALSLFTKGDELPLDLFQLLFPARWINLLRNGRQAVGTGIAGVVENSFNLPDHCSQRGVLQTPDAPSPLEKQGIPPIPQEVSRTCSAKLGDGSVDFFDRFKNVLRNTLEGPSR